MWLGCSRKSSLQSAWLFHFLNPYNVAYSCYYNAVFNRCNITEKICMNQMLRFLPTTRCNVSEFYKSGTNCNCSYLYRETLTSEQLIPNCIQLEFGMNCSLVRNNTNVWDTMWRCDIDVQGMHVREIKCAAWFKIPSSILGGLTKHS